GKDRENRCISNANGYATVWRVEKSPALLGRQAHGLPISWHRGGFDKIAVGRVCPAVAVGLEVRKKRPKRGHFAANRAVGQARGTQRIPPGRDLVRAHAGELAQVV